MRRDCGAGIDTLPSPSHINALTDSLFTFIFLFYSRSRLSAASLFCGGWRLMSRDVSLLLNILCMSRPSKSCRLFRIYNYCTSFWNHQAEKSGSGKSREPALDSCETAKELCAPAFKSLEPSLEYDGAALESREPAWKLFSRHWNLVSRHWNLVSRNWNLLPVFWISWAGIRILWNLVKRIWNHMNRHCYLVCRHWNHRRLH